MQNLLSTVAVAAVPAASVPVAGDADFVGPVQPVVVRDDIPATDTAEHHASVAPKAKRASKPKAAKPVIAPEAKPEAAPAAAKPSDAIDYAAERNAAATAVSAYYSGASLPFKSAHASLSDLNSNNAKRPSVRTAALVAAMLAYGDKAFNADGTFARGAFRVPAKLINPEAKPGDMLAAMPESGCLGNMLGRVVHHVSGPIGGKHARDGIFRLDYAAARVELQQLGDATAKPALAVLNRLAKRAA